MADVQQAAAVTGAENAGDAMDRASRMAALPKADVAEVQHNAHEGYKCYQCKRLFTYQTTLNAHMRTHGGEYTYACNKCSQKFSFYSELQAHTPIHDGQKGYKCNCGRTFAQYTDLLYHKHLGEEDEVPIHDRPTKTEVDDARRSKYVSTVRRDYMCQYCGKAYESSKQLTAHIEMHRGERKYKNALCTGHFKRSHVL